VPATVQEMFPKPDRHGRGRAAVWDVIAGVVKCERTGFLDGCAVAGVFDNCLRQCGVAEAAATRAAAPTNANFISIS
jgi:hypothetical protein